MYLLVEHHIVRVDLARSVAGQIFLGLVGFPIHKFLNFGPLFVCVA